MDNETAVQQIDERLLEDKSENDLIEDHNQIDVNEDDQNSNDEDQMKDDPAYLYTKLDQYTSEIYKIEIQNVPRYTNHAQLKKLFVNKFNITQKKVKAIKGFRNNSSFAYVTFVNEQDRDKAIKLANDYVYKNCKLRVSKAKPLKDPAFSRNNKYAKDTIDYDSLSDDALQELLFKKICPLWCKEYSVQMEEKEKSHTKLLKELLIEIDKMKTGDFRNRKLDSYDLTGIFEGSKYVKTCKPDKYRNKCEFSIGMDKSIGFRLGTYREGNLKVVKPRNCPLINEKMVKLIDLFEKFIEKTELQTVNSITHSGNLEQITIRTTSSGCMLIVDLNKDNLSDEKVQNEINKLKLLIQNEAADYVTSLYVRLGEKQLDETKKDKLLTHIYGDLHLIERMRNDELQFRISPLAFFQVNVKATEILYQTITEMANLNENVIVLDVCCGVGTIGIYLANKVKFVLGIELNEGAVEDAKYNAELNGVNNIRFYCGYAEENLSKMIKDAKQIDPNCEIVAILDPPRAGLKNNIIKLIRSNKDIVKLIYVSCEPKFSRQNLIDLCRPASNAYQGSPFRLTKAVSVDMFPHTENFELVTLLSRACVSTAKKLLQTDKVDYVEHDLDFANENNKEQVVAGDNLDTLNNTKNACDGTDNEKDVGTIRGNKGSEDSNNVDVSVNIDANEDRNVVRRSDVQENGNEEAASKINKIDEKEIRKAEEVEKAENGILNCNKQINIDEKEVKKMMEKDSEMVSGGDCSAEMVVKNSVEEMEEPNVKRMKRC